MELKRNVISKRQLFERKIENMRFDYPRAKEDLDDLELRMIEYIESLKEYYQRKYLDDIYEEIELKQKV